MILKRLVFLICLVAISGGVSASAGSCVPSEGTLGDSCRKIKDEKSCAADSECVWVMPFKAQKIKIQEGNEQQPAANEKQSE